MNSENRWRQRLEVMVPPLPWDRPVWRDRGGERVVLLHGLWRSIHAMDPLARALSEKDMSTLNLPYPSMRLPLDELVQLVREEIGRLPGRGPIHLVTHSLGGILARLLLQDDPPWEPGRLVMLAPPNGGSEIVDWVSDSPLLRLFLGPAGCCLGCSGLPPTLPALPSQIEAAIIMGQRSTIPFFRELLGKENDGIVAVARGRITGVRRFSVIDADHTFIQLHPEALRRITGFLKAGAWDDDLPTIPEEKIAAAAALE